MSVAADTLFVAAAGAPGTWEVLDSLGSFAAALAAAVAIWIAVRDNLRRATFDHLRDVNLQLERLGDLDVKTVQRELIRYHERHTDVFPAGGQAYLNLINALELLAFAVKTRAVDRRIATEYLSTILGTHVVPYLFLHDLQKCQDDLCQYLLPLVLETKAAKRDRSGRSDERERSEAPA